MSWGKLRPGDFVRVHLESEPRLAVVIGRGRMLRLRTFYLVDGRGRWARGTTALPTHRRGLVVDVLTSGPEFEAALATPEGAQLIRREVRHG
jgi:hypothetical protein